MSTIPQELKYTKTHEWIRKEDGDMFTIGITDHAQSMLGDFVFIDLPKVGDTHSAGKECCVVESVKAASDVYIPISGTIESVNSKLEKSPELVNKDPYGEGWLFKIKATNPEEINKLLDAAAYAKAEAEECH